MKTYIEIDAMGKPCPMPLLLLKKQIKLHNLSQNYLLKASDPNSEIDIARYCQIHNYSCKINKISEHEIHYLIEP
jgi:tRNA 2-thiouridine synthesizing protein A